VAGWEHHNTEPLGSATPYDNAVDQVRFGEVALGEDGQLGAAPTSGVVVDDPAGALDFTGWSLWYLLETGARANVAITGTVSKTADLPTVTGAGTSFTTELEAGDEIAIPGGGGTDYVVVKSITDNTHLELYLAPGYTAAGQVCTRSGLQRTWSGIVGTQELDRGDDREDGGEPAEEGVDWSLDLTEINGLLHTRILHTDTWNRKVVETPGARIAALMASDEMADLGIVDLGLVDYPTTPVLDPDDMRGRPLDEAWNAIAIVVKRTFAVRYHELSGQLQMILKKPTDFYLPTAVTISNYLADKGATGIWVPDRKAKLTRDPTRVADGLYGTGSKWRSYRTRPATTDVFGHHDDSAPNETIKSLARLQAYLDADLLESSTQDEHGHVSIPNVPAADVNKVQKLSALQIRMQHWKPEAWRSPGRWARVLRREVHDQAPGIYRLELDVAPCDSPPAYCPDYARTAEGTWPALGGNTPTSTSNPASAVVYYLKAGLVFWPVPTPGYNPVNNWAFPVFGVGGPGTADYMGVNAGNRIWLILVGAGIATISLAPYLGVGRDVVVDLLRQTIPGNYTLASYSVTTLGTQNTAGGDFDVDLTSVASPLCISIIDISDAGSGAATKIGFAGLEWIRA